MCQARLPGATNIEDIVKKTTEGAGSRVYANNMVRVDADVQKIDKFFPAMTKVIDNINNRSKKIEITHNDTNDETDKFNRSKRIEITHNGTENDETDKIDDGVCNKITDLSTDVEMREPDKINETQYMDSSIAQEPKDTNKISDRWKMNIDQGNLSYVDPKESFKTRKFQYERVETKLTSVKQLRLDVENNCNMNLREILANLIFIACIDCHKSLIQHSTKLYLCDTTKLT